MVAYLIGAYRSCIANPRICGSRRQQSLGKRLRIEIFAPFLCNGVAKVRGSIPLGSIAFPRNSPAFGGQSDNIEMAKVEGSVRRMRGRRCSASMLRCRRGAVQNGSCRRRVARFWPRLILAEACTPDLCPVRASVRRRAIPRQQCPPSQLKLSKFRRGARVEFSRLKATGVA